MTKTFSYIIYKILFFLDKICQKIFKRSFLIWFKDFIEEDAYKKIGSGLKIKLFTPNFLTNWLANDFFNKEPETITWINNFKKFKTQNKIKFWDIGANIGIYSIYAGKSIKI